MKQKFSYLAKQPYRTKAKILSWLAIGYFLYITESTKNAPNPLSPKLGKVPVRVVALAFDLCVLFYRSPCIL